MRLIRLQEIPLSMMLEQGNLTNIELKMDEAL